MTGRVVGALLVLALLGAGGGYLLAPEPTPEPGEQTFTVARPVPAEDPGLPVEVYRPDPDDATLETAIALRTALLEVLDEDGEPRHVLSVPVPVGWRETTVVAWSGMRGVVTVATALALPTVLDSGEGFGERESVVVAALLCVMVTLLVQGMSLGPLTKRLQVAGDVDEAREVSQLRDDATHRALEFLDSDECADTSAPVREAARLQYEGQLASHQAIQRAIRVESDPDAAGGEAKASPVDELRSVLRRVTDAERDLVLQARRTGAVSSGSADEVLREIEGRALRDFG